MKFAHACNRNIRFAVVATLVQVTFLLIFGIAAVYGPYTSSQGLKQLAATEAIVPNKDVPYYHFLKDVMVMMVVGFGFLMTFLKKYGYSSVGYNLFLCALVIQWAIILHGTKVNGLFSGKIHVDLKIVIESLFTLCAILVSFGAVLGKLSLLQLFVMAVAEVPILIWNEHLGRDKLQVVDTGDSIFVHCFGAYYGLAIALVMYKRGTDEDPKVGATYNSDLFSMIGTLFLWIYWPSFNGGTAQGHSQSRALLNTILSLCGATIATAVTSAILPELEEGEEEPPLEGPHKFTFGRFNMVYLQNSTIAGGVAIGSCCAMMVSPCLAILIGFMGGFFSVLGFRFFTKYMNRILHDTCGVHNLHGFPSLISAIASACAAGMANADRYGDELFFVFPALSDKADVVIRLPDLEYTTELNWARSAVAQGGFQIAGWTHTFTVATVGGLVVGVILRFLLATETPKEEARFDDLGYWDVAKRDLS